MKTVLKQNKKEFLFLFLLLVLGLFDVIRVPCLPGLYRDSVNPDFFALHLLNPGPNNQNLSNYIGIPFIGALYHGTFTMFTTMLAVMLAGKTSPLLLWSTNAVYGVAIAFLVYLLLKRTGFSERLSVCCSVVMMLSPQMFTHFRNQFYLFLPGAVFVLLAAWFALKFRASKGEKDFVLCAVFLGVAFYVYFCHLFFAPGVLLILFWKQKTGKQKFVLCAFRFLCGFCLGCGFFFLGYSGGVLYGIGLPAAVKPWLYLFAAVIYYGFWAVNLALLCTKKWDDRKKLKCFAGELIVIAVIGIVSFLVFLPRFLEQFNRLHVFTISLGLFHRIFRTAELIFAAYNNSSSEGVILAEHISIGYGWFLILSLVLLLVNFIIAYLKKTISEKMNILRWLFAASILFCVCAFPLVHRMAPHHFYGFYYLLHVMLFVNIAVLSDQLKLIGADRIRKWFRVGAAAVLALLLMLNLVNQTRVVFKIDETGGRGLFTENINKLSSQALTDRDEGKKLVYIFPQWGFKGGFDYLTMNEILYYDEIDSEILNEKLDEGYEIRLCVWSEDNARRAAVVEESLLKPEANLKQLLSALDGKIQTTETPMINRSGEKDIVVYSVTRE